MKKLTWIIIGIICLLLAVYMIESSKQKQEQKIVEENIQKVNIYYSEIYDDVEASEEKFLALFEQETDLLQKGKYASALVQVYTIKHDYEKILQYGEEAIYYYSKVKNGIYYILAEQEYISWTMLSMRKYSESFSLAQRLLKNISSDTKQQIPQEVRDRVEVFIDSTFLYVYTEFNILDQAKIYYDKLAEQDTDNHLQATFAKFKYALKMSNEPLSKQYADEYYNILLERDYTFGTDLADTVLLYAGISSIQVGRYEEALDQLKKAQQSLEKLKDKDELANVYRLYAICYQELGQQELARYYCEKTIRSYIEVENYIDLKRFLEILIQSFKEADTIDELQKMYKVYYEISIKTNEDTRIHDLLSKIVTMNEEMNKCRQKFLQKKVERKQNMLAIGILIIGILSIILTKGYFLVRKQKETEERLEHIANTDYLTGVCTRSYGEKLIKENFGKENNQVIAIIDIDNFKFINDTYGHAYGDDILKSVAQILQKGLDEEDIIYRFGGEEFIVGFVGKSIQQAYENLECIREQVNHTSFEKNIEVTFSAGLRSVHKDKIEVAMKKADELLYEAKTKGKNQIRI